MVDRAAFPVYGKVVLIMDGCLYRGEGGSYQGEKGSYTI